MIPEESLDKILRHYQELEATMAAQEALSADDYVRLSKEYADLTPVVEQINAYRDARNEIGDLAEMIADPEGDAEMRALAEEEFYALKARLPDMEHRVKLALLPRDSADAKNAILEIRAGTGGEEAALFAGNLLRMYQRYAELHRWKFELINSSHSDLGGIKEAVVSITGADVFARLKYESGVHRVQRVPETEAGGRIHTSAATVAVLPEAEEVDVEIDDKDLRIDVYRASGPGGQSVNTTDSAVRITHLPTGIVVQQQDEKSQHKNKAKAMRVLRARLFEQQRAEQDAARAADRKSQVGSGDRSERIRTYNFPQGRVTDHRINLTLYKLDRVITGEALDEVIDALIAEDQAERLAAIEQSV
jgi:peptide chain release factor 1